MHPRRHNGRVGPESYVLATTILVAATLIVYKVVSTISTGPDWDTYAFLANAAEMAGRGSGYTELHRPPFLSLLAAIAFQLGAPLHEAVIQWLDGALSLSGIAAFYLIARRRFRPLLSGVGALMLLAFQPLWSYLGSGYTDFPSVALSLWLLWACMKATEDHPAWYVLAGILFTMATLTRYTAILSAFPVVVWLLLRWRPFRHARAIAAGVVAAVIAYAPAARFYASRFGDVLFPFILAFGVSESISSPTGEGAVEASPLWYLVRLPEFLGGGSTVILGWLVLGVTGMGTVLGVVEYFLSHRPCVSRLGVALLACAPAVAAQFFGGLVLRQVTIPIAIAGVWHAVAPREDDEDGGRRVGVSQAVHAAMLAWLFAYLDMHGHQAVQVPRYIIPMAPGIVFSVLYGWQTFVIDVRRTLTFEEDRPEHATLRPFLRFAAPISLGVMVAVVLTVAVFTTSRTPDPMVATARESADWLKWQGDLDDAVVFSDLWPLTSWYTGQPALPMPFYTDEASFQHALDRERVDYYVTIRGRDYEGFVEVARTGSARILERTGKAPEGLPRVLYLGKAWDNYLETVTENEFYLMSDAGRYGWEGSAFLDSRSSRDLAEYRTVAVYGVRWSDRAEGEEALLDYVREGGRVVIDASSNLGELPYDLANTVIFDTIVQRGVLPKDAEITVDPLLLEVNPDLADLRAAPFVDESGGPWFGAEYSPLPGSEELTVLASVGGKPAVALRRIGAGRVYWIGYNLVWHAFLTENPGERALITAVFEHALSDDRER